MIEVAEFESVPVICGRDSANGNLERGELYTRSWSKPESSKRRTQNEMRLVLELATEKQLRRFVAMARGADLDMGLPSDRDKFDQQYDSTPFAAASGAQLILRVRPSTFASSRLAYRSLSDIPRHIRVSHNGWVLPEDISPDERGDDWLGVQNRWRAYQSGLLILAVPLPRRFGADEDGIESLAKPARGHVPVWWLAAQITSMMELASTYQQRVLGGSAALFDLELKGAGDWQLVVANFSRSGFHASYRLGEEAWVRHETLSPEEALACGRPGARKLLVDLFERFGWRGVSEEIVADLQNQTLGVG